MRSTLACAARVSSLILRAWGRRLLVAAALLPAIASCGQSPGVHAGTSAAALKAYIASIEPIRLGVNTLLNGADPIIDGWKAHKLTDAQASAQMGTLEAAFAGYTVDMAALVAPDPALASINAPYAHTFILEDSYLNALVNGLEEDNFSQLPDTQADQRAAIIQWRVQLEVLANALHVTLPSDLQQAGRGEIAPSVTGDS
jgi:hypothetical protein